MLVTYCSLVQHFDRERFCHVMLTKSLFQLLQWGTLPFPKHHQVNITESKTQSEDQDTLKTHKEM